MEPLTKQIKYTELPGGVAVSTVMMPNPYEKALKLARDVKEAMEKMGNFPKSLEQMKEAIDGFEKLEASVADQFPYYETMILGGEFNERSFRANTEEAAREQHERAIRVSFEV